MNGQNDARGMTPGPWKVVEVEGNLRVAAGPNSHVALVHNTEGPDGPGGEPDHRAEANARAIAALPELIRTLSVAMKGLEDAWAEGEGSPEDAPGWYRDARDLFIRITTGG